MLITVFAPAAIGIACLVFFDFRVTIYRPYCFSELLLRDPEVEEDFRAANLSI